MYRDSAALVKLPQSLIAFTSPPGAASPPPGISASIDLLRDSSWPISLQLDVQNLLDRFYLFNFESVFSGTHIGRPREISARLVFHWKAKSVQSP